MTDHIRPRSHGAIRHARQVPYSFWKGTAIGLLIELVVFCFAVVVIVALTSLAP